MGKAWGSHPYHERSISLFMSYRSLFLEKGFSSLSKILFLLRTGSPPPRQNYMICSWKWNIFTQIFKLIITNQLTCYSSNLLNSIWSFVYQSNKFIDFPKGIHSGKLLNQKTPHIWIFCEHQECIILLVSWNCLKPS